MLLSLFICLPVIGADKEKELPKHFKSLKVLAKKGDANAQNTLAVYYNFGIGGVGKDAKEAVKWFRKAAEQGLDAAQINLGSAYETGEGVPQDMKGVVKWYRKAAEQGHSYGQYRLGAMYMNGLGVTLNHKEARKWFRKAAEQGYDKAQCALAVNYAIGKGVFQNYVAAYAWANIAAANGSKTAPKVHGFLGKKITAKQIVKAEELSKEILKKNPKLIKKP
jgi:TPR repeat protein